MAQQECQRETTCLHTSIPTNTGVRMEHVLLLNNAFYVDSIKNTWVGRGGGTTETPWAIC